MTKKGRAHLPFDVPTLAEQLESSGYETHILGKWHMCYDTWNATPTGRDFSSHLGVFPGRRGLRHEEPVARSEEGIRLRLLGQPAGGL